MPRKKINLHDDTVRSSFFKYLIPALSGMLIKSAFIMGDALFVGRGVGAEGLGAIAITIPYFAFFTAIGMMFGIGGAALMSIAFGKNKTEEGQSLFVQSVLLTTIISAILASVSLFWLDEMIALTGATGNIATLAKEYLDVMLMFFFIYGVVWVVSCFVRNDTNPRLAMYAMSGGAISNLVLDYIFIMEFGWGMTGAAWATGISQVLIGCILLTHFTNKKGILRLNLDGWGLNLSKRIAHIGMPVFFIEVTSAVTIILFNYVLLHNYNEGYVVAYGLTTNVFVFALFTMVGIGQACQPIISFHYGAGNNERIREALFLGLRYALGSGVVYLLLVTLGGARLIASYYIIDQPEMVELSVNSLNVFFLAAPVIGLNMIVANLFQATANPGWATIISLSRGFVLVVVGMIILPHFFPENGIWGSILFAEGLTAMLSLILLSQFFQRQHEGPQAVAG